MSSPAVAMSSSCTTHCVTMRTELKRSGGGRGGACGGAADAAGGGAATAAAGRSGVRGGSAVTGGAGAAAADAATRASGPIHSATDAQPRRTTAREPPPSSGVSACTETRRPGPYGVGTSASAGSVDEGAAGAPAAAAADAGDGDGGACARSSVFATAARHCGSEVSGSGGWVREERGGSVSVGLAAERKQAPQVPASPSRLRCRRGPGEGDLREMPGRATAAAAGAGRALPLHRCPPRGTHP